MRVREDYRTLTGTEKAAIFMLALGEDYTAKLFEHMDDDEILELSQVMATLGKVNSNVVERLFVEFAEQMSTSGTLVGSQESTERMLTKAGMVRTATRDAEFKGAPCTEHLYTAQRPAP